MFQRVAVDVRGKGLPSGIGEVPIAIVEGVETWEQLQLLRDNNCDLAQGFFFDKPLPVEEFEKRLDTHKYIIEI